MSINIHCWFFVSDNTLQTTTTMMEARMKRDKTDDDTADIPMCDSEEYVLRKRLPRRLPKRPNDVYVSRKTDFRAQLARQGTRSVVIMTNKNSSHTIMILQLNVTNVRSQTAWPTFV